ncbi:RnfH family protein [Piscirickettsia litoralis]|uniref:UPF0125 protein BGC07_07840 n=1 Tax=Piscirickettsia litoralis TaxID=1891921 RepID=A0ABX3A5Y4_9GAMM|nr:RnfH family protein [Piscirickettsia litoralis]ODN42850.1 rnfH ubiquitin family protein [Piscirickettsia litoralis]
MKIEVVYGVSEDHQELVTLDLGELGQQVTAQIALEKSGLLEKYSLNVKDIDCGVWNRHVSLSHCLRDGDRVEVYRPLLIDPKEARRLRAKRK